MKQRLMNLLYKLQKFMYGRYGSDELSYALILVSILLMILSNFDKLWFLYIVSLIPLAVSFWRCLSKNIYARTAERNKFLSLISGPKSSIKLLINKFKDRKTHRYYKCSDCKSVLRVPKGRGKIEITCPKCGKRTVKKT